MWFSCCGLRCFDMGCFWLSRKNIPACFFSQHYFFIIIPYFRFKINSIYAQRKRSPPLAWSSGFHFFAITYNFAKPPACKWRMKNEEVISKTPALTRGRLVMFVRFRCKTVCGWFRCTLILQRVDSPPWRWWELKDSEFYRAFNAMLVTSSM